MRKALLALTIVAIPALAHAATRTVTNLDDSGPGSLRATIAAAGSGDTIVFAVTGTIALSSDTITSFDKHLIITGPGDPALITIMRAAGAPSFRLFYFAHARVEISGLTFTNGSARFAAGGAIRNSGGTLIISNCVFADNQFAEDIYPEGGGAIASLSFGGVSDDDPATLEVYSSTFINNRAVSAPGGAIGNGADHGSNATASAIIDGCTFSQNMAEDGGAIFNGLFGRMTIRNSVFVQNTSRFHGGAIYAFGNIPGNFHVETSTFDRNENTEGSGGALRVGGYTDASQCTVTMSCFRDNDGGLGGAILCEGPLGLTNSTFSGNKGPLGTAIFVNSTYGELAVRNCTFSGGQGTLIHQQSSTGNAVSSFGNTIFSTTGTTLAKTGGSIISHGYNLARDNGGGFLTGPADQLNADPKLDPQGLQNNGGPTATIALTNGSPAIDQGHSFGAVRDQRFQTRPFDNASTANASGGDGSDIGAFEVNGDPVQGGPNFVVTAIIDQGDGVCGSDCTLREAITRANSLPGANTISFAVTGTLNLNTTVGQLNISDSLTINGPGARMLTISGQTNTRIFNITGGSNTISGLTIAGGWVASSTAGDAEGGGIYNAATLELVECTLDFNRAVGGSAFMTGQSGGSGRGGGVFNAGTLTLTRCTLKNNGATGGFGMDNPPDPPQLTIGGSGGHGLGAGVYNDGGRLLRVFNCTFAANSAGGAAGGDGNFGGHGGNGLGGAIYNLGTLEVHANTFSGNSGFGGAAGDGDFDLRDGVPGVGTGGLAAPGGSSSTIYNSIVAGNTGTVRQDVEGAFTSGGFNLIGKRDGSTGFTAPGDQTGTNAAPLLAQLGGLANNGGATDTMLPFVDSPAVDKGHRFSLTTDQRAVLRPVDMLAVPNARGGDGSDVGAVELTPTFVTTLDDHNDGACNFADCTLREAIIAANAQPGAETIEFLPTLNGTIQLLSPLPALSTSMKLHGPGADRVTVRRSSGGDYRIFTISNGTLSGPTVTISGLTIANGKGSGAFPGSAGGGIYNDHGNLTVRDCTLSGNQGSEGGAIFNEGLDAAAPLLAEHCTFSGNSASNGGGIYNSAATAVVTNCTFSGNGAGTNGGGLANSGGFSATATMTLRNCTFRGNSAGSSGFGSGGGVLSGFGSALSFANNIFANNTGGSIAAFGDPPVSQGHNLSSDAAGGDSGTGPGGRLNAAGDKRNTDPMLESALTNNGGTTPTHALLAGSPAINMGDDALAPSWDQRRFLRLGTSDIGAFEFNGGELRIIAIARDGDDIVITFTAVAEKTFRLDGKDLLTESNWVELADVAPLTATTTGPALLRHVGGATAVRRYYRVRLVP